MARLLAPEREVLGSERLEHVSVADLGLDDADAVLGHRPLEPEVRHDGDHEGVVGELAALLHRDREDRHDAVAVDDLAVGVDCETAIGVAVVRDAHVGAVLEHGGLQLVEVRRADAVVDVHAVGVGPDDDDLGARIPEGLGRDARRGAVRAVEDDLDAVESVRQRAEQVHDVAVFGVGESLDAADPVADRRELLLAEVRLDAVFDVVGQLGAAV